MPDVSNNFLSRLFSAEMVTGFIGLIFMVGMTYASLKTKSEETNKRVNLLADEQRSIDQAVREIQIDIEVIKVDQRHAKQTVDEMKEDLRYIRDYIERGATQ